LIPGVKKASW